MNIKKVKIFSNNSEKSQEIKKMLIDKLNKNNINIVDNDYDLGIAIGGDGSFLRMIKENNFNSDIYYIGINAGTLGFAQEVSIDNIDEFIDNLNNNNFIVEELGIQENDIYTNESNSKFYSLNEIVIREKDLNTLKLSIYVDESLLESFAGDGILISTSFGSTAYNLSFGGSIVYNTFHSIQLTPIAPLNNRSYRNLINSVVLPQNKKITVIPKNTKDVIISVDGENSIYTDVVKIETVVRNKTIKCLRNKDYNFIKKINEKFLK